MFVFVVSCLVSFFVFLYGFSVCLSGSVARKASFFKRPLKGNPAKLEKIRKPLRKQLPHQKDPTNLTNKNKNKKNWHVFLPGPVWSSALGGSSDVFGT